MKIVTVTLEKSVWVETMHAAQKKQNVHHLKKNDNEKEFAICGLFFCSFFASNLVDGQEG